HVGAGDLPPALGLGLDHQLAAPPDGRGLGASPLALDLLAVGVQVEDACAVVDRDLLGGLGDGERLRRLEEAMHRGAGAGRVAVPVAPRAPSAAAPAAEASAPAAEAAAPASHASAAPSAAQAPATGPVAAARVAHLRPRVLALVLVERPLAAQA